MTFEPGAVVPDWSARAARVAVLGHRDPPAREEVRWLVDVAAHDPVDRVRAIALGALTRCAARSQCGPAAHSAWVGALADPSAVVRRRACEEAPKVVAGTADAALLVDRLADPDVGVTERAAWALGEVAALARSAGATARLSVLATTHPDALVREAAVAALGALGDPGGLPAILAGCTDRPQVRRRAVVALAPFEGPDVDRALRAASSDRDWQVRQAAEDLLAASGSSTVSRDPSAT